MAQTLESVILEMGRRARAAARQLSILSSDAKNAILHRIADALVAESPAILTANAEDIRLAEQRGLSAAMIDRLRLTEARIAAMAKGVREVAALPDPVGKIISSDTRPNGLQIAKTRTPIGVVGIIYESRPNVTSDAAVLCLKTGNAVILRGGSEAIHSNLAIAAALEKGGREGGLPEYSVQVVPSTDRDAVRLIATMDRYVDVIVPRGGHALIEAVVSQARMPVIKHYHGVCHVYVDAQTDVDMAVKIAINSKVQRPGVCNAMECLLVHTDIAESFFAAAAPAFRAHGVAIRANESTHARLAALDYAPLTAATEEDWSTEYLDKIMSVKEVASLTEAIDHIETYGSHHSDSIVTTDQATAERFLAEVDSAAVYWNASTRFTDGGEFGFGAEIGISTDKLHARGPMGLEELTTYKYIVRGNGQIRS